MSESIKYVPCKDKKVDLVTLKSLSQEELIDRVLQLQAHNEQLRNIISKQIQGGESSQRTAKMKEFDFTKWKSVHILLKFLYFGWNYQGYVVQEDTIATVEHYLMNALSKCKLIQSRETCNYHRCGRTDKGVSAFSQVISLTVRAADEGKPPLEYCKMLNRLLPPDIRVIAWQPVCEEFSARFNCKNRAYKYFFPKADLDLQVMNEAAKNLIGTYDFRNLCKMDVGNGVTNFTRTISQAEVTRLDDYGFRDTGYEMCVFTLTSQAFLWHQVRCIMAVLLLVGKRLEDPSVIKELLDVDRNPRKPQYPLSSDIGLNLFYSEYEKEEWIFDKSEIMHVLEVLQGIWAENAIKASHVKYCMTELEKLISEPIFKQTSKLLRQESKIYKPLLSRNLCSSLEEKIDHFVKRRRITREKK